MTSYLVEIKSAPSYEDEIDKYGDLSNELKISIDNTLPSVHLWCLVTKIKEDIK